MFSQVSSPIPVIRVAAQTEMYMGLWPGVRVERVPQVLQWAAEQAPVDPATPHLEDALAQHADVFNRRGHSV